MELKIPFSIWNVILISTSSKYKKEEVRAARREFRKRRPACSSTTCRAWWCTGFLFIPENRPLGYLLGAPPPPPPRERNFHLHCLPPHQRDDESHITRVQLTRSSSFNSDEIETEYFFILFDQQLMTGHISWLNWLYIHLLIEKNWGWLRSTFLCVYLDHALRRKSGLLHIQIEIVIIWIFSFLENNRMRWSVMQFQRAPNPSHYIFGTFKIWCFFFFSDTTILIEEDSFLIK